MRPTWPRRAQERRRRRYAPASNSEVVLDIIPLIVMFAVVAALVLLAARLGRKRIVESRPRGPQYVWVAVIGPSNAESTEGTHRAAYLLLQAGLRMRLAMAKTHVERGLPTWGAQSVDDRAIYSTEAFRPHKADIRTLEDFSRYAPFRPDRLMHLSVHPEDVSRAARLLRDAGLVIELPPGKHWWH